MPAIATEPRIVRCEAFNDAQELGDAFIAGRAVDMFLDRAPEDVARRLKDFASGMVYVAGGTMKRIGPERFRLTNPSPSASGRGGFHPDPRRPTPPT